MMISFNDPGMRRSFSKGLPPPPLLRRTFLTHLPPSKLWHFLLLAIDGETQPLVTFSAFVGLFSSQQALTLPPVPRLTLAQSRPLDADV